MKKKCIGIKLMKHTCRIVINFLKWKLKIISLDNGYIFIINDEMKIWRKNKANKLI